MSRFQYNLENQENSSFRYHQEILKSPEKKNT